MYTLHFLYPFIESESNHFRYYDFVTLPSTLEDKSLISSIPSYFKNMESPIICPKYITYLMTIFNLGIQRFHSKIALATADKNVNNHVDV